MIPSLFDPTPELPNDTLTILVRRRAIEGNPWRILRVATQPTHRNGPGAGGAAPRPLVSELRLGGTWGTGLRQPRVLALGYEVGRL
jgi:hypothetical protein